MRTNHLDALFIPMSTHGSATYDALTINTWRAPVASNSGLPSIAMNIGYTHLDNMPIGIELVGKEFDEGTFIAISFAYEFHSLARIVPPLPDANCVLVNYSIPQINNIFNVIGKSSYDKVILTANPSTDLANILTPDIFKEIVTQQWELQLMKKHKFHFGTYGVRRILRYLRVSKHLKVNAVRKINWSTQGSVSC